MAYVEEHGLTPALSAAIRAFGARVRENWRRLLHSIQGDEGVRPAPKWLRSAEAQIQALEPAAFPTCLMRWFEPLRRGRTQRLSREGSFILRSFIWLAQSLKDAELMERVGEISEVEFKPSQEDEALSVGRHFVVDVVHTRLLAPFEEQPRLGDAAFGRALPLPRIPWTSLDCRNLGRHLLPGGRGFASLRIFPLRRAENSSNLRSFRHAAGPPAPPWVPATRGISPGPAPRPGRLVRWDPPLTPTVACVTFSRVLGRMANEGATESHCLFPCI